MKQDRRHWEKSEGSGKIKIKYFTLPENDKFVISKVSFNLAVKAQPSFGLYIGVYD